MPRTKKTEKSDDELNTTSTRAKKTTRTTTKTTKKATTGTKKASTATKKTATGTKKASTATTKKTTSKVDAKKPVSRKTTKKTTNTTEKTKKTVKTEKKKTAKEPTSSAFFDLPEYYDLPYRYNNTVVTVLAQNPNTLFVYWDVSDDDYANFKKKYGENFFDITKPVLVVHNLTENYSFEVDVNDFANNWYINVLDSKCNYSVELCRKPTQDTKIQNLENNEYSEIIKISYSNTIEMPNDHIMVFNEGDKVYFKNIKTNKVMEKVFNIEDYKERLQIMYKNLNLDEDIDRFDFNNPSSNNPTSNIMI